MKLCLFLITFFLAQCHINASSNDDPLIVDTNFGKASTSKKVHSELLLIKLYLQQIAGRYIDDIAVRITVCTVYPRLSFIIHRYLLRFLMEAKWTEKIDGETQRTTYFSNLIVYIIYSCSPITQVSVPLAWYMGCYQYSSRMSTGDICNQSIILRQYYVNYYRIVTFPAPSIRVLRNKMRIACT